jgi:hypothetical protein
MVTGASLLNSTALTPIDVVYDQEVFPNFFLCAVTPLAENDNTQWLYEVSERRNDLPYLVTGLRSGYWKRMFGFNNLGYDSPILHEAVRLHDAGADAATINRRLKVLNDEIIGSGSRWSHRVHWRDELVEQVDLFLMHHFDNKARQTSLKALEFAMRSRRVQDLPFHYNTVLESWQMDVVRDYGGNDIGETKRFAHKSADMIAFREKLGKKFMSANDTKIGKSFFIDALEKRTPGICYGSDRKPRQTYRTHVDLAECIFPWIRFERPETQAVLERLRSTTLRADEIKVSEGGGDAKVETKGVFKDLTATCDGFTFVYGTGGLHGSVSKRILRADALTELVDIDVEAFYPSIAIVNGVYPAHLGPGFVDVYRELKNDRVLAKQSGDMVKSDALKLANNGVYGDSNNYYGPFLDPKYTMTITVNGQLMLTMAAEQFMKIPGLEIIQANTDGLTLRFPRSQRSRFDDVCRWWCHGTGMKLEEKQYDTMWIRDVNAYIARYSQDDINGKDKGKYKRKGDYDYELKVGNQKAWHRDHSSLIIPKAVNAAFCEDKDPREFITNHSDMWDFLMRQKVDKNSFLHLADGTECQKIIRYYIAHDGQSLIKTMPPLAKAPEKWRRSTIHAEGQAQAYGPKKEFKCSYCGDHGPTFKFKYEFDEHNEQQHNFKIKLCNTFDGGSLPGLNYDYYVRQTEKLLF